MECGQNEYVVITLLGKIKGEAGDRAHLIPSMMSGIRVREKVKHLLDFKRSIGQVIGPAISDLKGKIYSSISLLVYFLEILVDFFC
jgi:hypothetical protein